MKKISRIIIYSSITLLIFFSIGNSVTYALDDYTVLAPLPGTYVGPCPATGCTTNFETYIPGLINWSMGIAAVMAFVVITMGGIMYMTTDAIYKKEDGRKWIEQAIWGLVLVIGAWVILNTINPQILKFTLTLPQPVISTIGAGGVVAGVDMTEGQSQSHRQIGLDLRDSSSITTGGREECSKTRTTNCVNLNNLQAPVISGLKKLKTECPRCSITITGGTEPGHSVGSAHHTGRAVDLAVDLRKDYNDPLIAKIIGSEKLLSCKKYTNPNFTGTFLWEPQGVRCGDVASSGNHWHVSY